MYKALFLVVVFIGSTYAGKCADQKKSKNATCTADGNYEPKQCIPGTCWCVDPITGIELPGSRRAQGTANSKPLVCGSPTFAPLCKQQVSNGKTPPPTCSSDGNFEPKQCVKGSCWCVDRESGVERPGSRTTAGTADSKPLDCGSSSSAPLCKQQVSSGKTPPPTCSSDGNFEPKQCVPGSCWCVDPQTGVERPGSRTTTGTANSKPLDCGSSATAVLPLCKQREGTGSPSFPAPTCSSDGNFEPMQCQPGSCWCVNTVTGEEVPGSRKTAGTANSVPPTCSNKPCVQQSQGNGPKKPTCTKDGNFEPLQCMPGSCWCVNPITGAEIEGTSKVAGTRNSQTPNCSDKLCVVLSQSSQKNLKCKPDGSFEPKQCRPGYCYCVDTTTGEEIPGTGRMIGTDGGASVVDCSGRGPGPAPPIGPLRGLGGGD